MSRYAMEWAKQQRAVGANAKLVLLLIADRALGIGHNCTLPDSMVIAESGLNTNDFADALGALVNRALVTTEPTRQYKTGMPATRYTLQICDDITFGRVRPPTSEHCERPTALYRLFDASDDLLYVGVTDALYERFRDHARDQPWWHEVKTREIEWYGSRAIAESIECRAIVEEAPRYNRTFDRSWRHHSRGGSRDAA